MKESDRMRGLRPGKGVFVSIAVTIVVLGLGVSFLFGALYKPYTAVYLSTGDVYYGKLSTFPGLTLHDPWFVQRMPDGNFSLAKFSDAFWKPRGAMRLSSDKVVFTAKLDKTSPIVEAMEGRIPTGAMQGDIPAANQQGIQGLEQFNPGGQIEP